MAGLYIDGGGCLYSSVTIDELCVDGGINLYSCTFFCIFVEI